MAKGNFELANGYEGTIARRSVDTQTENVLRAMTLEASTKLIELGAKKSDFQKDTTAAIDELANDDDLGAIKRRLAAQIIQDDAVATHLTEIGLALIDRATSIALEQGLSAIRTAAKVRDSSRKGLQALAEIKRPKKTTFIAKQQNLAVLQKESDDRNLKTIEESEHGRVDFGTQTSGTGKNGESETMEAVYWSQNEPGESVVKPE